MRKPPLKKTPNADNFLPLIGTQCLEQYQGQCLFNYRIISLMLLSYQHNYSTKDRNLLPVASETPGLGCWEIWIIYAFGKNPKWPVTSPETCSKGVNSCQGYQKLFSRMIKSSRLIHGTSKVNQNARHTTQIGTQILSFMSIPRNSRGNTLVYQFWVFGFVIEPWYIRWQLKIQHNEYYI